MNRRRDESGLAWQESGRGDAVLFVHAFPLHGGMWREQLSGLPQHWRYLAPDLRGFGGSSSAMAEKLHMDLLADDLAAFLDMVEVDRATVCGLSMGGYVTMAFWRRHADRVRAVVLANTRAGTDTGQQKQGRRELAAKVRREGAAVASEALLPKLLSESAHQEQPDLVERVRSMIEENEPATIGAALEGMAERPDSTDILPGIHVPVLVVVGSADTLIAPAEAEEMANAIPGASLCILAGAGHLTNMEQPAEFNRELLRFLRTVHGD